MLGAAEARSALFYVAPSAAAGGDGSIERPFRTIVQAQTAVRSVLASGCRENITVYLRGGLYSLEQPLTFDVRDSASAAFSVTYAAYPNEKPVISGGRVITGFSKGADNIWTAPMDSVKSGAWRFRQLYVDGRRLPRGRFPEKGFLKIISVSEDSRTLRFSDPLPEMDLGNSDTEVVVVQNWSISRELLTDNSGKTITAATPIGWVGHSHCLPKPGMNAFLEHSSAFLKKPGQWYLDRKTGRLQYKAAEGEDPNTRRFSAPVLTHLLTIEGRPGQPVRNLHFRGITFEQTGFLLPEIRYGGIQACYHGTTTEASKTYAVDAAIEMAYCTDCSIADSPLRQLGGSGIGLGAGCRNNRIIGCLIQDIGATGINIGHMKIKNPLWADWPTPADVPSGNEVANCLIRNCGVELWGAHAIFDAMTRGTHIRHNEISQMPYGAVATGYVWNTERTSQQGCVIEYNHIHDVMLKLNDSGCIYTLGFQPGSIIRGNLLHGVRFGGFAGGQVCNNGIFFDEGSKGFLLEDNVIYDVDQLKGSRNTAVRYNHSRRDWHIWINNTITTAAERPAAAEAPARTAGLEAPYRPLLDSEQRARQLIAPPSASR